MGQKVSTSSQPNQRFSNLKDNPNRKTDEPEKKLDEAAVAAEATTQKPVTPEPAKVGAKPPAPVVATIAKPAKSETKVEQKPEAKPDPKAEQQAPTNVPETTPVSQLK